MDELFINGAPDSFSELSDYTEEDKQVVKDINKLIKFNRGMFFKLVSDVRRNQNLHLYEKNGNKLEWKKNEKAYYFTLRSKKKEITKVLKSIT